MKCLNCLNESSSGVLWFRSGRKWIDKQGGIDPETYEFVPLEREEIVRVFMFCSKECEREFFLDDRWFKKSEVPISRRLISREEVIAEFQAVLLSDKEEQKDLVYILGQSVWR